MPEPMTDLARLKALADGATPGPLEARYAPGIPTDCVDFGVISHATGKEVMRVWAREDAELYAALSPDVVAALIARVERAEAALRELQVAAGTALEMLPPERQEPGNPIADFLASIHRHCAETLSGDEPPQNLARTALAALEAS